MSGARSGIEDFGDYLTRVVGRRWVLARRSPRLVRMGYEHFLSSKCYRELWNAWALSVDWTRASDRELEVEWRSPLGTNEQGEVSGYGIVEVRRELARRWLLLRARSDRRGAP